MMELIKIKKIDSVVATDKSCVIYLTFENNEQRYLDIYEAFGHYKPRSPISALYHSPEHADKAELVDGVLTFPTVEFTFINLHGKDEKYRLDIDPYTAYVKSKLLVNKGRLDLVNGTDIMRAYWTVNMLDKTGDFYIELESTTSYNMYTPDKAELIKLKEHIDNYLECYNGK